MIRGCTYSFFQTLYLLTYLGYFSCFSIELVILHSLYPHKLPRPFPKITAGRIGFFFCSQWIRSGIFTCSRWFLLGSVLLSLLFDAKLGFLGTCLTPVGGALWNPEMILLEWYRRQSFSSSFLLLINWRNEECWLPPRLREQVGTHWDFPGWVSTFSPISKAQSGLWGGGRGGKILLPLLHVLSWCSLLATALAVVWVMLM